MNMSEPERCNRIPGVCSETASVATISDVWGEYAAARHNMQSD